MGERIKVRVTVAYEWVIEHSSEKARDLALESLEKEPICEMWSSEGYSLKRDKKVRGVVVRVPKKEEN
jgi:hypothetical protein